MSTAVLDWIGWLDAAKAAGKARRLTIEVGADGSTVVRAHEARATGRKLISKGEGSTIPCALFNARTESAP